MASTPAQLAADARALLDGDSSAAAGLRATVARCRAQPSAPPPDAAAGFWPRDAVPPLEQFLERSRRQRALGAPLPGSVVRGRVAALRRGGALVLLERTWAGGAVPDADGGGGSDVSRAGLVALLHASRLLPPGTLHGGGLVSELLRAGDEVCAVVVGSVGGGRRVALSIRSCDCALEAARPLLGCWPADADAPPLPASCARLAAAHDTPPDESARTLNECLSEQIACQRPDAARRMRAALGVSPLGSCLAGAAAVAEYGGGERSGDRNHHGVARPPAPYERQRHEQNVLWAAENVEKGVAHAQAGRLAEALTQYQRALELDPHHVDAFVARGAALANAKRLHEACADLERALRLRPNDANAQQYLATVRAKLAAETPGGGGGGGRGGNGGGRGGRGGGASAAAAPAPKPAAAPPSSAAETAPAPAAAPSAAPRSQLVEKMLVELRKEEERRDQKRARKEKKAKKERRRESKSHEKKRKSDGGEGPSRKKKRSKAPSPARSSTSGSSPE